MGKIIISTKDGSISYEGIPQDCEVEIRCYDIEGIDIKYLEFDKDGNLYFID